MHLRQIEGLAIPLAMVEGARRCEIQYLLSIRRGLTYVGRVMIVIFWTHISQNHQIDQYNAREHTGGALWRPTSSLLANSQALLAKYIQSKSCRVIPFRHADLVQEAVR